jgi:hypothetical protein
MADIDFQTDLSDGTFRITLGDNPISVIGNRALVNKFEITFMTKARTFVLGNTYVTDNYAGNAQKFINKPQVLNNIQSIATAVSTAVDLTVQCMLDDQNSTIPDTEKLSKAELVSLDVINGMINAVIKITPVVTESYDVLKLNLPITKA